MGAVQRTTIANRPTTKYSSSTYDTRVQSKIHSLVILAAARATCPSPRPPCAAHRPAAAARTPRRMPGCMHPRPRLRPAHGHLPARVRGRRAVVHSLCSSEISCAATETPSAAALALHYVRTHLVTYLLLPTSTHRALAPHNIPWTAATRWRAAERSCRRAPAPAPRLAAPRRAAITQPWATRLLQLLGCTPWSSR